MLLEVETLLPRPELAELRSLLAGAEWVDGRVTAGHQSAQVKDNLQVPEGSAAARAAGALVLAALERNPLFIAAVLPRQVFPPLFNRYDPGMTFGAHVDNAIRAIPGSAQRLRTDVSCTLFLADPESYDGGELIIEDTWGERRVKLPAGHAVLYPATSLHRVAPVTRGSRLASFFWIQSMVRDDGQRRLLFELDLGIQRARRDLAPNHPAVTELTGVYHNLLRAWADA